MVSRVWEGRTVVCIASGPSLKAADCQAVKKAGLPTVAVNSSWRAARFADVVYGGDLQWWDAYGAEIDIPAERWTCTRQAAAKHQINHHAAYGPYNSGMRAIQFAVERGAARILLLGYDCSVEKGLHWHGEHARTANPTPERVRLWHRQFAAAAALAKARKCEVLNCSRETALMVFERCELKDALSMGGALRPIVIRGMQGLGDSIYQRAFVKRFPGAYIETSWPELYSDLDVKPVRPRTRLRTQTKNAERWEAWHSHPSTAREVRIGYGARDLSSGSILDAMCRQFGVEPSALDLSPLPSPISPGRPYAIVRPVTERREWHNSARNPRPEYVAQSADEMRSRGIFVVSVADLAADEEWLVGDPPSADLVIHGGELGIKELMGAVQHASVVVGGVGWIVPASIAAGTPLYVIHGGHGGHNHRSRITAPWMDLSKTGWAEPRRFCMCTDMRHNCEKTIDGFADNFRTWLDGQGIFGAGEHRSRLVA